MKLTPFAKLFVTVVVLGVLVGLVVGKQNPAPGTPWNAVEKEPFTLWLGKAT